MSHRSEPLSRDGFTLIELLVVVVILGVLASLAIGHFRKVQEKAMVASLENDLRVLSIQEEIYFSSNGIYTTTSGLANFRPSAHVSVSITHADHAGWAAIATHDGYPGHKCAMFIGSAPTGSADPATQSNVIACD